MAYKGVLNWGGLEPAQNVQLTANWQKDVISYAASVVSWREHTVQPYSILPSMGVLPHLSPGVSSLLIKQKGGPHATRSDGFSKTS